jgi:hypothetical protein
MTEPNPKVEGARLAAGAVLTVALAGEELGLVPAELKAFTL